MSSSSNSDTTKRNRKISTATKPVMSTRSRRQATIKNFVNKPPSSTEPEQEKAADTRVEVLTDSCSDGEGSQSEDGLTPLTSTPEIGKKSKLRTESALLRIRAQIRAAAQATQERSLHNAPEPEDIDKETESSVSDTSVVAGGAVHDLPRLADTLLQRTKTRLEEQGDLSKELREAVCDGLHGLYEMILKLADSRNRHIIEKEKIRCRYEQLLVKQEARHVAALEKIQLAHQDGLKEILDCIKQTHKEAESSRWLAYDIDAYCKAQSKSVDSLAAKIDKVIDREHEPHTPNTVNNNNILNLRDEVAKAKKEMAEMLKIQKDNAKETDVGIDKRSYAKVTAMKLKESSGPRPHYPLMLESTDPRDTVDDVVNILKNNVDVIELGIGVNSIRRKKNQKVVIGCDSAEDRNKLESAIKSKNQKLTVSQVKAKNPLLRLSGVINSTTDKQIEDAIIKQNANIIANTSAEDRMLKVIRRTKSRNKETCNVIAEVSPCMWQLLKDRKLRIGYQVISSSDQSPVVQCFQCLGYGHLARDCRHDTVCGYCADQHDTRSCPNRTRGPICANCKKNGSDGKDDNHCAYSSVCPEWRKWDRIARGSISYC